MRYLLGLNFLLLAASTTMALVLSVVLLIYWVYRDEDIIQASFSSLLTHTGIFAAMVVVTGLATQSLRQRWSGFWALQLVLLVAMTLVVMFYLPE